MPSGIYKRKEETKIKMRENALRLGIKPPSRKGIPNSPEQRIKISNSLKGIIHSKESILKRAETNRKNYDIKGRKTPFIKALRMSLEYKLWRESVFKRDNFTCIWCGQRGGKLNADHIKPFSQYPELRFAIDNGRTLCESCHLSTDTFGTKSIIKCH